MKTHFFILIILCLMVQFVFAQHLNQVIMDTTLHEEVLIDTCNRDGLAGKVFGVFYQQEYASYSPDATVLQQMNQPWDGYQITIVMGSWCGDSQEQVPRFFKILDQILFPESQVTLICVDRKKKTILADISGVELRLVPTFIIVKDNLEAGRIIETPSETLEKDLLTIVQTLKDD
ncbi:MAG TPA: thioredoxin family protein [Bacteroidales bacterium]|nr:thioredoxin family protein [Bacteroidales bacterium]HNS47867.1 thioredoxin family protein [Bacteroidales bacterium]